MDASEIERTLFAALAQDEQDRYLGYEWLKACGYTEPAAVYAKAKSVMSSMVTRGLIESRGKEPGRRGKPGMYWGFTADGWREWEHIQAEGRIQRTSVEDRLREKGKLRANMPTSLDNWREIVKLCRSGRVDLILVWKDTD